MEPIREFFAMKTAFTSSDAERRPQTVELLIGLFHRAPDAQHTRHLSNTSEIDISSSTVMQSVSGYLSVCVYKQPCRFSFYFSMTLLMNGHINTM